MVADEDMRSNRLNGIAITSTGVLLLSPDVLILRLLDADPWTVLWWRGVLSGIGFAFLAAVMHGRGNVAVIRGLGWRLFTLSGLFGASTSLFVFSVTHTSAANALVILRTAPFFAALFGWLFLRERVRTETWMAIAVVTVGIAVIFQSSLGSGNLLGDICAVGTATAVAGTLVTLRSLRGAGFLPGISLGAFLAAIVASGLAEPTTVTPADTVLLLILGLGILPISLALIYTGPRYLQPAEVSLIMLIETVLGPFWVWLVIGERPTVPVLAAGVLIVATFVIHTWATQRSPRHRSQPGKDIE